MKKLSIKGLADFMTASASRQRSILREYKYPDEDEPRAKRLYYREARDRVAVLHKVGHHPSWLATQASELDQLAANSSSRAKTRLRHNARGLRAYAQHFALKPYSLLDDLSLRLAFGDVVITVVPDLHVKEGAAERIIKLDFSVGAPESAQIKIISQAMFEAAVKSKLSLQAADVLYLDVERGVVHKGAKLGARMARDIEAACQNLSAIWDTV